MLKIKAGLFACISVIFICGCNHGNQKQVQIVINGQGTIPTFIEGTWQDKISGWEFVFEKNGNIKEVIIPQGRVRVEPGVTTKIPMKNGGEGIYRPGKWIVTYTPALKELIIEIEMAYIKAVMPPNTLEGKSRDILACKLADNQDEIMAEWISIPEYIAYTPAPQPLEVDPEDATTRIILKRVKPTN